MLCHFLEGYLTYICTMRDADKLRAGARALRAAYLMYLAGVKSSAPVRGPTAHTTETNSPQLGGCMFLAMFSW